MKTLAISALAFSEVFAVSTITELNSVLAYLIVALIICGINSILIPFVQWCIKKVSAFFQKYQKTKEQDGELADFIVTQLKQFENEMIAKLNNTTETLKNEQEKIKQEIKEKTTSVVVLPTVENNTSVSNENKKVEIVSKPIEEDNSDSSSKNTSLLNILGGSNE